MDLAAVDLAAVDLAAVDLVALDLPAVDLEAVRLAAALPVPAVVVRERDAARAVPVAPLAALVVARLAAVPVDFALEAAGLAFAAERFAPLLEPGAALAKAPASFSMSLSSDRLALRASALSLRRRSATSLYAVRAFLTEVVAHRLQMRGGVLECLLEAGGGLLDLACA